MPYYCSVLLFTPNHLHHNICYRTHCSTASQTHIIFQNSVRHTTHCTVVPLCAGLVKSRSSQGIFRRLPRVFQDSASWRRSPMDRGFCLDATVIIAGCWLAAAFGRVSLVSHQSSHMLYWSTTYNTEHMTCWAESCAKRDLG